MDVFGVQGGEDDIRHAGGEVSGEAWAAQPASDCGWGGQGGGCFGRYRGRWTGSWRVGGEGGWKKFPWGDRWTTGVRGCMLEQAQKKAVYGSPTVGNETGMRRGKPQATEVSSTSEPCQMVV
jgi:hypothetical protein